MRGYRSPAELRTVARLRKKRNVLHASVLHWPRRPSPRLLPSQAERLVKGARGRGASLRVISDPRLHNLFRLQTNLGMICVLAWLLTEHKKKNFLRLKSLKKETGRNNKQKQKQGREQQRE